MDSQNLFSYTVRPDREDKNPSTDVFDLNAYTVRTLSPDVKVEKAGKVNLVTDTIYTF